MVVSRYNHCCDGLNRDKYNTDKQVDSEDRRVVIL